MRRLLVSLTTLLLTACGGTTQHQGVASGGSTAAGGFSASGGSTATGGNTAGSGATSNACDSAAPGNYFAAELLSSSAGGAASSHCLPRTLTTDSAGRTPCALMRFRPAPCSCDLAQGLHAPMAGIVGAAWHYLAADSPGSVCSDFCACELTQLEGTALVACQSDPGVDAPAGFCYVDSAVTPASEALVAHCPQNSKRLLRFLGDSGPMAGDGSRWIIACSANVLP